MMQPFFVIAARLCPIGCEAALYSFFMSTFNFGHAASGFLGSGVMPLFGVAKGSYDGLTNLLLLRSACMLMPLLLLRPLLGGIEKLKTE